MEKFLNQVKVPTTNSNVYKDECLLCYETPKSKSGLFICFNSFQCFCEEHLKFYVEKSGNKLFLNLKQIKKDKEEIKEKPKKLAIGIEGGFNFDGNPEYDDLYSFIALSPLNQVIPLPSNEVPIIISQSYEAIKGAINATMKQDQLQWDGTNVKDSIYTENLKQIENTNVPKTDWICSKHDKGCDIQDNLWLCLTCGSINCGRKNWDGSGGNNHGIEHFEQTEHPLAVKLGTITSNGDGDIFSYFEKDMVKDPFLSKHLEFFGLKISDMKKTAKTMAELELDRNLNFESARIEQSGKNDVALFGPKLTGLKNLGNSCYLASSIQCLFSIKEFQENYGNLTKDLYLNSKLHPSDDFDLQFSKLGQVLLSGKYSIPIKKEDEEKKEITINKQEGIPPKSFKLLIGKDHSEFSTSKQQDALEFIQHLMGLIEKNSKKTNRKDLSEIFKFKTEERIECISSHKVKYSNSYDFILPLNVPLDLAKNLKEYQEYQDKIKKEEKEFLEKEEKNIEEAKLKNIPYTRKNFKSSMDKQINPIVSIKDCIKVFGEKSIIDDFYSTAMNQKTKALKTNHLSTFPDYLIISINRFIVEGLNYKKLNVSISDVDEIDLSSIRGFGKKENEELLPENKEEKLNINQEFVDNLVNMGFEKHVAEKAVYKTNNSSFEQAMEWIFSHQNDSDINDPIIPPKSTSNLKFSDDDILMLGEMGFKRDEAILALSNTNNDMSRAVEWLFSHQDELSVLLKKDEKPKEKQLKDGKEVYELFGVISHIGSNTQMGHYVCFIKMNDKWVKFNDSDVESCENPPLDLGYVYFYKRK